MSDITRAEAIEILSSYTSEGCGYCIQEKSKWQGKVEKAFELAINSLKAENEPKTISFPKYEKVLEEIDFVEIPKEATNGDVIKALFPDKELWSVVKNIRITNIKWEYAEIYESYWWNSPYRKDGNNETV